MYIHIIIDIRDDSAFILFSPFELNDPAVKTASLQIHCW